MNAADKLYEMICDLGDSPVIAIDGRSASGKTTLASELAGHFGFGVVHMDDFFLPAAMRTQQRLAEPGGNIHRERFIQEVLPLDGTAFSYRPYVCSLDKYGEAVSVPAGGTIVEGAYSLHPEFGKYYSLAVFLDIDPQHQQQRIISRSGVEKWFQFRDRWIPMEEAYHSFYDVKSKCDLVLNSSAE